MVRLPKRFTSPALPWAVRVTLPLAAVLPPRLMAPLAAVAFSVLTAMLPALLCVMPVPACRVRAAALALMGASTLMAAAAFSVSAPAPPQATWDATVMLPAWLLPALPVATVTLLLARALVSVFTDSTELSALEL